MADATVDIDTIIDQLLGVRGARPGRQVNLTEGEIRWLCIRAREIFSEQPVLLELEAPIKICGKSLLRGRREALRKKDGGRDRSMD